jgi:hypothetical protein
VLVEGEFEVDRLPVLARQRELDDDLSELGLRLVYEAAHAARGVEEDRHLDAGAAADCIAASADVTSRYLSSRM